MKIRIIFFLMRYYKYSSLSKKELITNKYICKITKKFNNSKNFCVRGVYFLYKEGLHRRVA